MAALTTPQLLSEIRHACLGSSLVQYVEDRIVDIDILHVRVHLILAETFINAFYNVATDKAAFALIRAGQRIYGADNAKVGWHYHPFADPNQHIICPPMNFSEFLHAVEEHFTE